MHVHPQQVIQEFVISVGRVGGWYQVGGSVGHNGHKSLFQELRERPDLIHGFSTKFDSGLCEADSIPKTVMTENESAFPEEVSSNLFKFKSDGAAFTLRGVCFLVVWHFWKSLCIMSKLRREGVVVYHLSRGMLLVCTSDQCFHHKLS